MNEPIVARWREWSGEGIQHLVLRTSADGVVAEAVVLTTDGDAPFAARFRIDCDRAWRTRGVAAGVVGDHRRIDLTGDGEGRWRDRTGRPLSELDGAMDVDLPLTPFTNTLPIRRLGLERGQSTDLRVVYVRLPEFAVEVDPQRYTCLDPGRRYRYESLDGDGDFVREIEVDGRGLVVTYPGLFRRVI